MGDFPERIQRKAWERQRGLCAYCGKTLVWAHRDQGLRGAWHAHHRKPKHHEGKNSLGNCALLCINPPKKNCHLLRGHNGNTKKRVVLYDYELRYLYGGDTFTPLDKIETPLDRVEVPLNWIKPVL